MKLVPKGSSGSGQGGSLLPDPMTSALVRWYTGKGSKNDEAVSVALVQNARRTRLWLACDCRSDSPVRPVISPALLTSAETYYLRRLTGRQRAQHDALCPFHRAQVMSEPATREAKPKPIEAPAGYFAVLKPEPEKLAQKPDDDIAERVRSASIPKLARLLWFLMERAGTNHVRFDKPDVAHSISDQFKQLKHAATTIEIAPRITLDRAFHTHGAPYHSGALYARLRASAAHWPKAHAPQAFMLLYAHDIDGETVHLASGEPIVLATRVQSPRSRANPVSGPFLVLIVVGEHPDIQGYAAIRGYAQPVHSGHHFVPVDTNSQRSVVDTLIAIGHQISESGAQCELIRPLFDFPTPAGLIRPDLMIDMSDPSTGEMRRLLIMVQESTATRPREIADALADYAPVIRTDAVGARNGRLAAAIKQAHSCSPAAL